MSDEETWDERFDRVRMMSAAGHHWDLSPNDLAALKAVVKRIEEDQKALDGITEVCRKYGFSPDDPERSPDGRPPHPGLVWEGAFIEARLKRLAELEGVPSPRDPAELLARIRVADDDEALRDLNNELGAAHARGIWRERADSSGDLIAAKFFSWGGAGGTGGVKLTLLDEAQEPICRIPVTLVEKIAAWCIEHGLVRQPESEPSQSKDEPTASPGWYMAARRWAAERGLTLLVAGVWWEGGGRIEVAVCCLSDKGLVHRILTVQHVPPKGDAAYGRLGVADERSGGLTCYCSLTDALVDRLNIKHACCQVHVGSAEFFNTPEEHQAVMELRAKNPDAIDLLLLNLSNAAGTNDERVLIEDFARAGTPYRLEHVVDTHPIRGRRVKLVVRDTEGDVVAEQIILSGPVVDVDDYLAGRAMLADIEERWKRSGG